MKECWKISDKKLGIYLSILRIFRAQREKYIALCSNISEAYEGLLDVDAWKGSRGERT